MLDRHRHAPDAPDPAKAGAVPVDAFARWHDMSRMRAKLQTQVLSRLCPHVASSHDVFEGEVTDARYHAYLKPTSAARATMTLCYQLSAPEAAPRWITVRAFIDGSSDRYHRALRSQGIEAVHLEADDAVAWCFPDDPGLPQLCELLQADGIASSLASSEPPSWRAVRYRPMQRCALEVRAMHGAGGPIAFGKVYSDERGRLAGEQLSALAHARGSRLGDVQAPTVLGYDERRRTLWLAHFEGRPLAAHDLDAGRTDLIARLARSVAQLHLVPLPASPASSYAERLAEARRKVAKIRHAHPRTGPVLDRAIDCAARSASRLPSAAPACQHGDLHLGQWLRSDDALMLADFDELAIGDPELDLANLDVDLRVRGLAAPVVDAVIEQFIASYRAAGGPSLAMPRVRWYQVLHWINRAYRLFLQQRPGLESALDRAFVPMLTACDALDGGRT